MKTLKLTRLEDALAAVVSAGLKRILDVEVVPIEHAVGRVLAESITAERDLPRADLAAIDGYATRFEFFSPKEGEDVVELRIDSSRSDHPWAHMVFTGQPLPEGADVVVRKEHVRIEGEYLIFRGKISRWENVERRGSFYRRGETMMMEGEIVRPPHVALLSEQGLRYIKVYRRPMVSVIGIGSELSSETERAIPNDYCYVIASYLTQIGCEVTSIRVLADDVEMLRDSIGKALEENDLIVTIGRASTGENDVVARVYSGLDGAEVQFHGINIHPGKPTGLVVCDEKGWLILPGSITAAMAGFHLVGLAYLRSLMRVSSPPPLMYVTLDGDAPGRPGINSVYFVSFRTSAGSIRASILPKGVNNLYTASNADAYVVVPPNNSLSSGSVVLAFLLGRLAF